MVSNEEREYLRLMQLNNKLLFYCYDNNDAEFIKVKVFPNDKVEVLKIQDDFTTKTYTYNQFEKYTDFGRRLARMRNSKQEHQLLNIAKKQYNEKYPDLDFDTILTEEENSGHFLESNDERRDRDKEFVFVASQEDLDKAVIGGGELDEKTGKVRTYSMKNGTKVYDDEDGIDDNPIDMDESDTIDTNQDDEKDLDESEEF